MANDKLVLLPSGWRGAALGAADAARCSQQLRYSRGRLITGGSRELPNGLPESPGRSREPPVI